MNMLFFQCVLTSDEGDKIDLSLTNSQIISIASISVYMLCDMCQYCFEIMHKVCVYQQIHDQYQCFFKCTKAQKISIVWDLNSDCQFVHIF